MWNTTWVFFPALSTSDNYPIYTVFRTSVRVLGSLLVLLEIWHLVGDELRLEDIIFGANVTIIHLISVWKIMIMVNGSIFYSVRPEVENLDSFHSCSEFITSWTNKMAPTCSFSHVDFNYGCRNRARYPILHKSKTKKCPLIEVFG